jgi:CheY-like chemotaxis protein
VLKVLVIEDNEDARDLVRFLLEAEGYDVECAENGRAGLDAIRRAPPALILLDLMMPVMSGWELLDHLRADPALDLIPVGVMSAAHDLGDARALPYVAKPIHPDALLEMVACLVGRRARALALAG